MTRFKWSVACDKWQVNSVLLLGVLLSAVNFQPSTLYAQVATGTPPFGSFSGGPDIVNNGNLNVHIEIPVLNKPGRGMPLNYNLTYDSSIWTPVGSSGNQSWAVNGSFGWGSTLNGSAVGYISYTTTQGYCVTGTWPNLTYWYFSTSTGYKYVDSQGSPHGFDFWQTDNGASCGPHNPPTSGLTSDGSGSVLSQESLSSSS